MQLPLERSGTPNRAASETGITCPLTHPPSGPARNETTWAIHSARADVIRSQLAKLSDFLLSFPFKRKLRRDRSESNGIDRNLTPPEFVGQNADKAFETPALEAT